MCAIARMVSVAQLARALGCGPSGCGFKPHPTHFKKEKICFLESKDFLVRYGK